MAIADDVSEIKEDVKSIRRALFERQNGRAGLFERVALLEQSNRLARFIIVAVVSIATSVVGTGLAHTLLFPP